MKEYYYGGEKKKEFYAIRGIDLIFKILKLKNGLIYTIKKC